MSAKRNPFQIIIHSYFYNIHFFNLLYFLFGTIIICFVVFRKIRWLHISRSTRITENAINLKYIIYDYGRIQFLEAMLSYKDCSQYILVDYVHGDNVYFFSVGFMKPIRPHHHNLSSYSCLFFISSSHFTNFFYFIHTITYYVSD